MKSIVKATALFVLIGITAYLAFHYAPVERTMGIIQKIFYLHISCAFSAFVAFGICFYANLRYVFTRQAKADWLGVSAAEVGVTFITVVLITGPIWAHPVWGIWWTWDARLTLTFVLGLLYLSYLLMWGALTGLLILLMNARYRLEALRASVEELRREAEVR